MESFGVQSRTHVLRLRCEQLALCDERAGETGVGLAGGADKSASQEQVEYAVMVNWKFGDRRRKTIDSL